MLGVIVGVNIYHFFLEGEFNMPNRNKKIEGFMVLLQLSGIDKAKAFLIGDKDHIKFNIQDPLHRFLVSMLSKRYRRLDITEKFQEAFGIKIWKKDQEEADKICKKVVSRMDYASLPDDPLSFENTQRSYNRRKLFKDKVKKFLVMRGFEINKEYDKKED